MFNVLKDNVLCENLFVGDFFLKKYWKNYLEFKIFCIFAVSDLIVVII